MSDLWHDIINQLDGSNNELEDVLASFNVPNLDTISEFTTVLNKELFRCSCCQFWYGYDEESEHVDDGCINCYPDEDFEDDEFLN